MQITVKVGFSPSRPVVPEQEFSLVAVEARGWNEASLMAAQMVASRKGVAMVTSTSLEHPAVVGTATNTRAELRKILEMT